MGHTLRTFENRVLKRIFGPKRKWRGGWRRLLNEELHNLYTSPNIIRMIKPRRMRFAEHVSRMGDMKNAYIIFVGKPEVKISLGRQRRMWDDNIRMGLRGIGW
jgi:hypothetical protein